MDLIANKLVAAMVEQHIGSEQALFQPSVATSGQKRNKGILKASNSPKPGINYLLESSLPAENSNYMLTSQSESLIHEYMVEEQYNRDYQAQFVQQYDYEQM